MMALFSFKKHTSHFHRANVWCCITRHSALDSAFSPHMMGFFPAAGLTIGVTVLEGTFARMYGETQAARLSLSQTIKDEGVKGFPDVVASNNISDGICHL